MLRSVRLVVWSTAAMLVCATVYLVPGYAQEAAPVDADVYSQLCWRHIGPAGNRVSAVAGVPGDELVYYAGGASGGIFKTTDAGLNWTPDLRRPAGRLDRVAGGRAVRPEHRVGGHGRVVHPEPHLGRRRDLQVGGRRPDVDADGARADGPDRPGGGASDQPGGGARVRLGARLRPAAGARRVSDDGRRRELGARALRRRADGLLGARDGSGEPAEAVCGDVADRHQDVGAGERRAGQRAVREPGRRDDVAAAAGAWAADARGGEGEGGDRAVEPGPRVCADRDG